MRATLALIFCVLLIGCGGGDESSSSADEPQPDTSAASDASSTRDASTSDTSDDTADDASDPDDTRSMGSDTSVADMRDFARDLEEFPPITPPDAFVYDEAIVLADTRVYFTKDTNPGPRGVLDGMSADDERDAELVSSLPPVPGMYIGILVGDGRAHR